MKLPRRLNRLAYWLAPAALILGVSYQRYSVVAKDQSAWSGGGFGMFSTVDISNGRPIRAYLLTDRGEILARDPQFGLPRYHLATLPTEDALTLAARTVLRQEWTVYEAEAPEALTSVLPLEYGYFVREGGPLALRDATAGAAAKVRIALPEQPAQELGEPLDATVLGARVEVWRPVYDRQSGRLGAELIRAATVQKPRS